MQTQSNTECACGSKLPQGKPSSQERFLHNTSREHRLAVAKEKGLTEMVARIEAEVR